MYSRLLYFVKCDVGEVVNSLEACDIGEDVPLPQNTVPIHNYLQTA